MNADLAAAREESRAAQAAAEAAAEAARRALMIQPASPADLANLIPMDVPDEPLDPLDEALEAFYDAFAEADYAERWRLVDATLAEQPELWDEEMVFDTVDGLFGWSIRAGDHARFAALLDTIERQFPAEWAAHKVLYIDWRAACALLGGDRAAAHASYIAFSQLGDDVLDLYERLIALFAWHGELPTVIAGAHALLATIEPDNPYADVIEELLGASMTTYEIFDALERGMSAQDAYAALAPRVTDLYKMSMPEQALDMMRHVTGEQTLPDDLTEFRQALLPSEPVELSFDKLNILLGAFYHHAWRVEGIPLARIAQGSIFLYGFLVQSWRGDLADEVAAKRRRKRARKGAKAVKAVPSAEAELDFLIPRFQPLDVYVTRNMTRFLFTPYYDIAALAELLPAWLRFLQRLHWATDQQVAAALDELKPFVQKLCEVSEYDAFNGPLVSHLQNWPARTVE